MLQRNRSVRLAKLRCFFEHPRVYTATRFSEDGEAASQMDDVERMPEGREATVSY
jgi:hypothetical protein